VFDHGIREALCCLGRVKYMYASLHWINLWYWIFFNYLTVNFFIQFL
jgi:hypothetical protein